MILLKKLIIAPLFLLTFFLLIYKISPVTKSYDLIFSLSLDTLAQLITICIFIALSSFLFVLFSTLSLDWKFILPVAILASLAPLFFFDQATGIILAVGIFISLILSFISLENTMKSYLTFQPTSLLGPVIRHLSGLLILVIAISYFLVVNKIVAQKGFELPDSLIDTALKVSQPQAGPLNDLIKQTVKDQIQGFIKPYLGYVPVILALLLFFILQSLVALINLLIYPLLWFIFFILEKSGFVKFIVEPRPVKKMVV